MLLFTLFERVKLRYQDGLWAMVQLVHTRIILLYHLDMFGFASEHLTPEAVMNPRKNLVVITYHIIKDEIEIEDISILFTPFLKYIHCGGCHRGYKILHVSTHKDNPSLSSSLTPR
jgi:hypothetical protein